MITYLGAWVDGGAYAKATGTVEQHAVEEVTLARAVHTGHGDYSYGTSEGSQDLLHFLVDFEFYER